MLTAGSLLTMPKEGSFEVSLGVLKFEIFTVSPIRVSYTWIFFYFFSVKIIGLKRVSCIATGGWPKS